jgi:hypothetical protein
VGATFDATTRLFRWKPDFGQLGNHSVTFTARDELLSATATLTVKVELGNRPPELYVPGPKSLMETELLTFTVSGSDPEGMPLVFGARDLPEGATFSPLTRTFSWTPTYSQAGRWTVVFTAFDGEETTEAPVQLTVGDVNRGPALAPVRPPQVFVGGPVSLTFTAEDPEGDAITYSSPALPPGSSLDAQTGRFTWVPGEAQVGQVVLRVRASDQGGLGSEITVTFQVQGSLVTGCSAGAAGPWAAGLLLSVLATRRRRR